MTSGGWGLCRPRYTNRMVGRPRPGVRPTVSDMDETLLVQERGQLLEFSYTDMLCYAGPYSPAGVANAFKVMQRAFAALSGNQPPHRRSIMIRTAFAGPGARDGFEAVTRAVTDGRYYGRSRPGAARPRPTAAKLRLRGHRRRPHGDAAAAKGLRHHRILRSGRQTRPRSGRGDPPRPAQGAACAAVARDPGRRRLRGRRLSPSAELQAS